MALGTGVIIRDAEDHVSGLTTAATIWVAAVLGTLCGLGYWLLVGVATVLIMSVLTFGVTVEQFAERIFKRDNHEPLEHSYYY